MADSPTIQTFVPFNDEDRQNAAAFTKLPLDAGVPFTPLGSRLALSQSDINTITTRTKSIADKSKAFNESKGRRRASVDPIIAKQLKRLKEETRSFQYTNPYFAGPQVGIFIGDKWVSNIITAEYTESSTDAPVYGYASRYFDAVMTGNVIVQGNFTIAFTDGDYLGRFLSNYSKGEGQNDSADKSLPDDPIARAKATWWGLTTNKTDATNTESPLNFRHALGINGVIGRGFDIRVFFGAREFLEEDPNNKALIPSGPVEIIKDVHVTGRSIVTQPSGDPIGESWSFFAKSVQTLNDGRPGLNDLRGLALRQQDGGGLRNLGGSISPGSQLNDIGTISGDAASA